MITSLTLSKAETAASHGNDKKKKHFQKVTHPAQGVTGKANGCININPKYPHKFILKYRLTDTAEYPFFGTLSMF